MVVADALEVEVLNTNTNQAAYIIYTSGTTCLLYTSDIRDKRKEAGLVTPDCLLWRECLSEAGLGEDCAVTERYGRCV